MSILEPVKAPSALTTVIIPHLEPEGTKELDKDGTGKNGKKTWFYSTVFYEKKNFCRFTGAAGTYLPTSPPSDTLSGGEGSSGSAFKGTFSEVCGTQQVAWMEGQHPKVQDGIVVRAQFIVQWMQHWGRGSQICSNKVGGGKTDALPC